MKTLLFTNYTQKPFTHSWDGESFTFAPGQSMAFVEGQAHHFAKHLAMQENNKKGLLNSSSNIAEEMKKALGGTGLEPDMSTARAEAEVLNYNEMQKDELLKVAEEKGLKVDKRKTPENIVKDLEAFEGAQDTENTEDAETTNTQS